MTVYSKEIQFHVIRDSLSKYSDDVIVLPDQYPFKILLNGKTYFILVNKTHEHGKGRPNPDACRIQVNKGQLDMLSGHRDRGEWSNVFGLDPETGVFSAWNPDHLFNRKDPGNFTVYSRFSELAAASRDGISVYKFKSEILEEDSFCINFHPEFLGMILENNDLLWRLDTDDVLNLPRIFAEAPMKLFDPEADQDEEEEPDKDRERLTVERRQYARDSNFRKNVIAAYSNGCCVCSHQLGIIEAAHIIPHAHDDGNDKVVNGLAMCPTHHSAYDTGLLAPGPDFQLKVSGTRIEFLKSTNQVEGLDSVLQFADKLINLPEDDQLKPNPDYLEIGLGVRGFRL